MLLLYQLNTIFTKSHVRNVPSGKNVIVLRVSLCVEIAKNRGGDTLIPSFTKTDSFEHVTLFLNIDTLNVKALHWNCTKLKLS